MPCDTKTLPGQTLTDRKNEVRDAIKALSAGLVSGKIKTIVGPQGAVAFDGWTERSRVTDACAYRVLMVQGSALAKAKIEAAQTMSGRMINKQVIGAGVHSHDGGKTWHSGH
jgi:hypothetical protein